MAESYINPYSSVEANYSAGMNSIATALAPSFPNQTITNLVDAVWSYLQTTYFMVSPPTTLEIQNFKTMIRAAMNGYINVNNGKFLLYSPLQTTFVNKLISGTESCKNPEDILQHITNIEEELTKSALSGMEQMPILYATAIGRSSYNYWGSIIATPGSWADFIDSFAPPITKFPFWISSSMEGALIATSMFNTQKDGVMYSSDLQYMFDARGAGIILTLFGSLGVGAGKVIFKFQKRVIETV